eukprot:GHVT01029414.1.p1 GENE.GHVT01029414.1~~GHVT01029414.1.p1  ORF type:complete len:140 (+),score=28.85 GHVT01029414.1:402-821(+)
MAYDFGETGGSQPVTAFNYYNCFFLGYAYTMLRHINNSVNAGNEVPLKEEMVKFVEPTAVDPRPATSRLSTPLPPFGWIEGALLSASSATSPWASLAYELGPTHARMTRNVSDTISSFLASEMEKGQRNEKQADDSTAV